MISSESWERTAIRVSLGVSCQSSSRGTEQKPDFVWWVCSLFLTEMSLMNHKVYSHPPKTTTGGALASYSLWLEQWQGHCRLFCGFCFFLCLSSMSCGYGTKISLVDMRSDGVMQNIGSRNKNASFDHGLFTTQHYHLQILCWCVVTAQRDSHESWHLWQFWKMEISHWDHEDTSQKYSRPHPNQWWEFGP